MFIVLEGGEGSGKTTAAHAIKTWLEEKNLKVIHTREPGGTPDGETIRGVLLSEKSQLSPIAQTLLFAAARTEHVNKLIKPKIDEGYVVLSDRFVLSTIAYQGAAGNVPYDFIAQLHRDTTKDFWPTLTIVLDVEPETGIARSRKRLADENLDEGYFENLDIAFHHSVRQAMLDAAKKDDNTVVIDASGTIEQVTQRITDALERSLVMPDTKEDT